MKRILSLWLALALCLTPAAAAETENASQAGQVVAQALSQMGYTEGAGETTKFGQRYGYPHGYWCDMFVSWCAEQAGVPETIFPADISCTSHTKTFKSMGRYQDSAARGGSYLPQQGDLVFFYRPQSGVIHHVGLVLYAEDGKLFTVEGNALTNRLDHPAAEVSALRRNSKEPYDYVTVNIYPLTDSRLYGYAVPDYTSREPLDLEGYVDLGKYSELQPQVEALAAAGVMMGTSSHTFSPRAGMERGAFLQSVAALCGLMGYDGNAVPFADVPASSPYYDAVVAARAAGLIQGDETNCFYPDIYVSGADAQQILSKAMALLGIEDQTFSFGEGDIAYIFDSYTTRIDIAQALYALLGVSKAMNLTTEPFAGTLACRDETLDWPVRSLEGECYVPLVRVLERYPELQAPGWTPSAEEEAFGEAEVPEDSGEDTAADTETGTDEEAEEPAEAEDAVEPDAGQSTGAVVKLDKEGRTITVNGFTHNGVLYVPLEDVANLLSVKLVANAAE